MKISLTDLLLSSYSPQRSQLTRKDTKTGRHIVERVTKKLQEFYNLRELKKVAGKQMKWDWKEPTTMIFGIDNKGRVKRRVKAFYSFSKIYYLTKIIQLCIIFFVVLWWYFTVFLIFFLVRFENFILFFRFSVKSLKQIRIAFKILNFS